jgi:hypothetical protein
MYNNAGTLEVDAGSLSTGKAMQFFSWLGLERIIAGTNCRFAKENICAAKRTGMRTTGLIGFGLMSGIICMYILNYFIVEQILVPDPCAWHSREPGRLFNLFYKIDSNDGYHPTPTLFNYELTALIGVVTGIFLARKIDKIISHE